MRRGEAALGVELARRAARGGRARRRRRRPQRPEHPRRRRSTSAAAAPVTADNVRDAARKQPLMYDKGGDRHYDTTSAFIKSMRGSDPDAALYYMAMMITAGEDPKFIARRMIVFASEDVGNADPQALQVAVAAARAVEFVGLPECRINLAQAAVVPGPRAEVERRLRRHRRGDGGGARPRRPAAAGAPARRQLPRRPEARPRRRLPLPARLPRRRRRPAAPARHAGGPPLRAGRRTELRPRPVPEPRRGARHPFCRRGVRPDARGCGRPAPSRPARPRGSPVALCSSSTGFTSTTSSEPTTPCLARISMPRWASR